MKYVVVALITLLAPISFVIPGTAQTQNRSQDFFEQGRERLERELETLREEPLEEANQDRESEPLLEVNPSPTSEFGEQLNEEDNESGSNEEETQDDIHPNG